MGTAAGAATTVLSTWEFPVDLSSQANLSTQGLDSPSKDVSTQVAQLNNQLSQLRAAQEAVIAGLTANTQALGQNTVAKATGASSALSTAGGMATDLFGGGGLMSIIGGLFGLFGGSSSAAPAPLLKFTLPPSINYEGALSGGPTGQVFPVDYGQTGQPRVATQAQAAQVNVHVSAMDSKSFLDHSDEIAQAVRKAILNSSSLNDVISDL